MAHPFAEWITKSGLTQHDVAGAWGVQDSAIWKITGAGRTIGRDLALRIWRFTGGEVSLDTLLTNGERAKDSPEHKAALKAIRAARRRKEKADAKKKKPKPRVQMAAQ